MNLGLGFRSESIPCQVNAQNDHKSDEVCINSYSKTLHLYLEIEVIRKLKFHDGYKVTFTELSKQMHFYGPGVGWVTNIKKYDQIL